MARLSGKTGIALQLGNKIKATEDNHYLFTMDGKNIELKKYSGAVDEGMIITCTGYAGQLLWKKKI